MKHILTLSLVFITIFSIQAQHDHNKCGMSIQDQLDMQVIFDKSEISKLGVQRGAKIYIPVKFHIVSQSDGIGGIRQSTVLRQLCKLNQDYKESEFVFYLKDSFDFNFIENTNIFELPGNFESSIRTRKDPRAMNVFITNTANTGQTGGIGTTLGYYTPQSDYIIMRKQELRDTTNTLSHEAGHFFSLPHTFFGWEGVPYSRDLHGEQLDIVNAPGTNIKIETMNGANCTTAADQICDTPPDYNFGIRANGCRFSLTVRDINGDEVQPMLNNQMSYFNGCDSYQFTADQTARMIGNYNLSARDYLKAGYLPNEDEMTTEISVLTPTLGEKIETHNSVYFSWEKVEGATFYLIEIFNGPEYFTHYTRGLQHIETRLGADKNYGFTVIPFNEANTCLGYTASNLLFRTGDEVTNTADLEAVDGLSIFPNPISSGSTLTLDYTLDQSTNVSIQMTDLAGKLIYRNEVTSKSGSNSTNISTNHIEKGIYVLTLQTENGTSSRKVVIQ